MGIVFNKANHSFGSNKFKYFSKAEPNHIIRFNISLDFADGVDHLINGKESTEKVIKIGKWFFHKNFGDSIQRNSVTGEYRHIRNDKNSFDLDSAMYYYDPKY